MNPLFYGNVYLLTISYPRELRTGFTEGKHLVQKLYLLLAALILMGLPTVASADVITFQAPATGANQGSGGAKQFDFDSQNAFTWRRCSVEPSGKSHHTH